MSRLVEERTGVPLPLHSPVVGQNGFMIDGAYWAAEANIPYEERVHAKFPVPPAAVGNRETVVWAPGHAQQRRRPGPSQHDGAG